MTWVVATVILTFLLAVMALAFTATEGLERESRIIADEMESFRLYDEQLQEKNRALRRYRHDANTLVQAIEYALAQEDAQGELQEGAAGGGSIAHQRGAAAARHGEGGEAPARTGLALVDAIVGLKRRQCADAGIAFSVEASPKAPDALERAGVPESDAAAVVQNLLENAYEASLRMEAAVSPLIDFVLECPGEGGVRIRVSNRVDSEDAPAFLSRKPNPERHGLGMRIVDDIARAHGGTRHVEFDSAARTLCVEVRL